MSQQFFLHSVGSSGEEGISSVDARLLLTPSIAITDIPITHAHIIGSSLNVGLVGKCFWDPFASHVPLLPSSRLEADIAGYLPSNEDSCFFVKQREMPLFGGVIFTEGGNVLDVSLWDWGMWWFTTVGPPIGAIRGLGEILYAKE